MSIKRRIELLLDKAAAKRVERGLQRGLVKGTDSRKPKQNLGKVGKGLNKLKAQALKLGAALIAAFAVQKIKQYITTVLTAFGRQERAILRVNSALMNMGRFTEENSKILQDNAAALQRITQAGDEAILEATATIGDLAKELTIGELAKAQEAAIALADTFFDGNLSSAATLLAKTLGSSTNALSRYGIEINTAASQSEKLEQILGITNDLFLTSQRASTDLTGRTEQLKNSWGDLHEAVGRILARGLDLTGRLVSLRERVDGWTKSIEENQGVVMKWARIVFNLFKAILNNNVQGFRIAFNNVQIFVRAVKLALLTLVNFSARAFNVMADGVNLFIETMNRIPGIEIDFRLSGFDTGELEQDIADVKAAIVGDVGDIGEALGSIADSWKGITAAADDASAAQSGALSIPNPEDDAATIAAERAAARRAQIRRAESAVAQQEFDERQRVDALLLEAHAEAKKAAEEALEDIQEKASRTGEAMTGAFQTFFDASATGFSEAGGVWAAAGQAARDAGGAIVGGLVAGRVETEMALGTAAIASGLWPPNPAAIVSGLKHFAAAALFRAIPGAISGGGGGGGGGGGATGAGVGALPRGALGASTPGVDQPIGAEINIFIDPLSPADPDFQRVVLGAEQNARERFGDNVKVNIHPRSGR